MILIAHRGNIGSRNEFFENSPSYVSHALSLGYDVEIDVWFVNNKLYLGHDEPQYEISLEFLNNPRMWIHCKNTESMEFLSSRWLNAFAHKDDIIITPSGFLWTAPGYPLTKRSIAVMPEMAKGWDVSIACGVCSDNLYVYGRSVLDNNTR